MVAKAVRIASAARAAMALADIGSIAETGALLRMIDDFVKEMVFIAEGEFSGKPTSAPNNRGDPVCHAGRWDWKPN
jgi:hypothetical protein